MWAKFLTQAFRRTLDIQRRHWGRFWSDVVAYGCRKSVVSWVLQGIPCTRSSNPVHFERRECIASGASQNLLLTCTVYYTEGRLVPCFPTEKMNVHSYLLFYSSIKKIHFLKLACSFNFRLIIFDPSSSPTVSSSILRSKSLQDILVTLLALRDSFPTALRSWAVSTSASTGAGV